MSNYRAYVISDLHLGSEFCQAEEFLEFLKSMPDDTSLILNGDTITKAKWGAKLRDQDKEVIDYIKKESYRREIIWVNGNHDWHYSPEDSGNISFTKEHVINDRIVIKHGHDGDLVRTMLAPLIELFHFLHVMRIRAGMAEVHTSAFAKQLSLLYTPYKALFIRNAVKYAKARNYSTVICGHVHHAEDVQHNGVRYLNTGCWVDEPLAYIDINKNNLTLKTLTQKKENDKDE